MQFDLFMREFKSQFDGLEASAASSLQSANTPREAAPERHPAALLGAAVPISRAEASAPTSPEPPVATLPSAELLVSRAQFDLSGNAASFVVPLSFTEVPDAPADDSTPYTLTGGDIVEGSIDFRGDEDWYRVEMSAGTVASIIITPSQSFPGRLTDQQLSLYDEEGNVLVSGMTDGPLPFTVALPLFSEEDSTYYVSASAELPEDVGDYALAVVEYSLEDIEAGQTVFRTLDAGEYADAYRLAADAGVTYTVTMDTGFERVGTGEYGFFFPSVSVFTADGQVVAEVSGGVGPEQSVRFTATEDANYYIAATFLTNPSSTGPYLLSVETDIDGGLDTPLTLEIGGTVEGMYDYAGDSDWYAITLLAGEAYDFVLEPRFGDLNLYDANGTLLEVERYSLYDSSAIRFEVQTSGTYFVEAVDASPGDYTLTQRDAVFIGTNQNDLLSGSKGADIVEGLGGEDTIFGEGGRDSIFGGDGNDEIDGGGSNDTIDGGNGDDLIEGGNGDDELDGWYGNDTILGGDDDDGIYGGFGSNVLLGEAGHDGIIGADGDDEIDGGTDDDLLSGEGGNDTLLGQSGDDTIFGGNGNDRADGGYGNDSLGGSSGNDTLNGGGGADRFLYNAGQDHIEDFDLTEDTLEFIDDWLGPFGRFDADDVLACASVVNGSVVFDDGAGDTLTLDSVSSLTGLEAAIEVVLSF